MTNLSKLLLEVELAVNNNEPIYNSLINWNYKQASNYLIDYLTDVCDIDLTWIEINANTMVDLQNKFITE